MSELRISAAFDGGNIEVLGVSPPKARLAIRHDEGGRFAQWFYFRVSGARHLPLELTIENASSCTYPGGWVDYAAVASFDRIAWQRVPTDYDGRMLTIRHTPDHDAIYYAYFAPYSLERHADRIARWQSVPRVRLEVLGRTLDGHDIDCLHVGEGARHVWLIARQHPGETMAEWFAEGFVERLLDRDDASARVLRERATFHVVTNMNPDGSRRGHLRTNAAGKNLNRAWLEPSLARTPEVFLVRSRMHETGVDLCLDVHGDEELPYNFAAGPDGIPSFSARQAELLAAFRAAFARTSRDFTAEHGYPPSAPGEANLRLCTTYVAESFGCLAVTIEQPFKDVADHPVPATGWSPVRAKRLGHDAIDAVAAVVDRLR